MVLNEISILSLEGKILVSENSGTFEVHELDVLDVVQHFQSIKGNSVYLFNNEIEALEHHKRYFGTSSKSFKSLSDYVTKLEAKKRKVSLN